MWNTRSKNHFEALVEQLTKTGSEPFQVYMNKKFYPAMDMFCDILTPAIFHGPSITTSPLEKINDMVKCQI